MKLQIRKEFLQKRLELKPHEIASFSLETNQNLISKLNEILPNLSGKIVALYQPIKNEVNLDLLKDYLVNQNAAIALPKIVSSNRHLDFILFSEQKLKLNQTYTTFEPENGKVVIPDIIIVPLVAFDKNLNRIGMGGGFYDRTINFFRSKKLSTIFIGIAYDSQYSNHPIPIEEFDQTLDFIVSQHIFLHSK